MMGIVTPDIVFRDRAVVVVSGSELAALIRRQRRSRGWTQEELEAHSGVSQTNISEIENGKTKRPQEATLRALADALGIAWRDIKLAIGDVIKEVSAGEEATVRTKARVPADASRWALMQEEYEGQDVQIPSSWLDDAAYPLFAVDVSGNCLRALDIRDGDVAVLMEYHGQPIPEGKTVLVMVDGEATLKAWHSRDAHSIELRNGDGVVVRQLSARDTFQVLGVVYKIIGDR